MSAGPMANAFKRLIHFDELVPRILRNVGVVFSGTAVVSLLGIVTLAVTARALGPAGVGILALVEAYVRTIDLLSRFQPTQAIIKYAAEASEQGNRDRFERLVKLSILIDLAGGALAGTIAIALGWWASRLLELGSDGFNYILLVSLALFISFRPTGIAVLRHLNRFDLLAKADVGVAVMRLSIATAALLLDLGIWAFIVILLLQSLADGIVAFALSMRELSRHGYNGVWRASAFAAAGENPGLLRFLWNSNINQILRQAIQRFDVLALGALVGPSTVGLYEVSKRSGKAVLRLARTLTQLLYPELAKLWIRGERARFRKMIRRISMMTFVASVVLFIPMALAVPTLVTAIFGTDFLDAVPLILMLGVSIIVNITGLPFNPALFSMGRHRELLWITILGTILFAIAFYPAVMLFSAMGAVLCHLLFSAVWFIGCLWLLEARPLPEDATA